MTERLELSIAPLTAIAILSMLLAAAPATAREDLCGPDEVPVGTSFTVTCGTSSGEAYNLNAKCTGATDGCCNIAELADRICDLAPIRDPRFRGGDARDTGITVLVVDRGCTGGGPRAACPSATSSNPIAFTAERPAEVSRPRGRRGPVRVRLSKPR